MINTQITHYFNSTLFSFLIFWLTKHQGGWELDESKKEAALRETIEEAGVRGTVGVRHLLKILD